MPVLKGGHKPVEVEGIEPSRFISKGNESVVYEVKVNVVSRGRRKTLTLVEKCFPQSSTSVEDSSNPLVQFASMQKLLKLNHEKKLGLNILPTIRLREEAGKTPSLIVTRVELTPESELSRSQRQAFEDDIERQYWIARGEGFHIATSAYKPYVDGKTGKAHAVIVDFGGVEDELGNYRKARPK